MDQVRVYDGGPDEDTATPAGDAGDMDDMPELGLSEDVFAGPQVSGADDLRAAMAFEAPAEEAPPLEEGAPAGDDALAGYAAWRWAQGDPVVLPAHRCAPLGRDYLRLAVDPPRESGRGGDGSLLIAQQLCAKGMRIVGVPKTIDNDVSGTITTFGFDTSNPEPMKLSVKSTVEPSTYCMLAGSTSTRMPVSGLFIRSSLPAEHRLAFLEVGQHALGVVDGGVERLTPIDPEVPVLFLEQLETQCLEQVDAPPGMFVNLEVGVRLENGWCRCRKIGNHVAQ